MFRTQQDVNYKSKIGRTTRAKEDPNAYKLQIFIANFQNIITHLSYNKGMWLFISITMYY